VTAGAVLAGYAADLLVGDPHWGHPVAGFGWTAGALERRLWRPRRRAGALHAAVLVCGPGAAAGAAEAALRGRPRARAALGGSMLWAALGGRSLAREGATLAALLDRGDLEGARRRAPALVGRDPSALGPSGLARAGVESIAENTADAVVGPLLWGALAGAGGAAAYRAANTLDAMVGHRCARYRRFGWAAARLDDVLTWPAARVGAALAVLLAPAVGGDRGAAWRALRRDGAAHPSPNAGHLEAAFAGALGIRLGGRNVYDGRVERRPHLGAGPPPRPGDVVRAARLSTLVGAAAALGAALLAGARGR
jgi:adenosylcobinamide-phosphate synthase